MSNSILERLRVLSATIELQKEELVTDFMRGDLPRKESLLRQHRAKQHVESVVRDTSELVELYKDKDKRLSHEIDDMSCRSFLNSYYTRLSDIRRYHRESSALTAASEFLSDVSTAESTAPFSGRRAADFEFSGAEFFGKCLDLNPFFMDYINLKVFKPLSRDTVTVKVEADSSAVTVATVGEEIAESDVKESGVDESGDVEMAAKKPVETSATAEVRTEERVIDYSAFLERFNEFWRLPNSRKDKAYVKFYGRLLEYLKGFYQRTQPLADLKEIESMCAAEFEEVWSRRAVEGWQTHWRSTRPSAHGASATARSLYCYACCREFRNDNTMKYHLASKKHLTRKCTAQMEHSVSLFVSLCDAQLDASKEMVEKKQTMSYEEIAREMREAQLAGGSEAKIDIEALTRRSDATLENPKNIPLDFDGKPIPYWLFKFRQLDRTFTCEICCNAEFRGPRAFERHFKDRTHAQNLRKLGIPNTKDFANITKIADALELWQKVKKERAESEWDANEEQEFEDSEGNVFKKSVYDQLKRQNII